MKKNNNEKEKTRDIFLFGFIILIYLVIAGYNFAGFLHFEKYGIIETAVVDSYSVKNGSIASSGIYYNVKIEYHLAGENKKQICSFDFKPSKEYFENEKIRIITDYKKEFRLPVDEKESFKRNKITANLIRAMGFVLLYVYVEFIKYIYEKNRHKNKRIKKLIQKDPALKEKYKKAENIKTVIILILLAPFLLIVYFSDKIKNKKK